MGRHTQYIVSLSQEEKNKLHAIIFKMDWLNIAEIELSADSEKEDVENVEKNWFFNGSDLQMS